MTQNNEPLIKLATVSLAVAGIGIIAALILALTRPEPQSFAALADGTIVPLVSVTSEMTPEKVTNFASSAILTGYRFDFGNYNTQLGRMREYLSDDAYNSFLAAIEPLKNNVVEKRLVSVVDIAEPTVITKSAVFNGAMMYKTSTVVLISLDGQKTRTDSVRWQIDIVLKRVPLSKNARGLQIEKINAKPYQK